MIIFLTVFGMAMPFREAVSNGVVCLLDSTDIQVKNNLTAIVKVHRSFEITSVVGVRFAQVIIPINNYIEVRDVKGYTELPGGAQIWLTKQDVGTSSQPAFKGFGDTQVVTFSLRTPVVGSKIYYQYKLIIKSLLYLPRIGRDVGYATNRMVVNLQWDKNIGVRYAGSGFMEFHYERAVRFVASNLAELPAEPYSCPEGLYLVVSAERFSYSKIKFPSQSWSDVGQFFSKLAAQPEEFQAELKALASRLTERAQTRQESLSALYRFLADSVSYVALEMGKGDFTPHDCPTILNRRFGDCKDQAILLSSLCRVAGFDAYPALISTANYPQVDEKMPWPAWFDHVFTVVKDEHGYNLLDPSDPLGSIDMVPPRLRGKSYLVCDGVSGLKTTPSGNDPASNIVWRFYLSPADSSQLRVDFSIKYIHDAARAYASLWQGHDADQAAEVLQAQLRYTGWKLSSPRFEDISYDGDTLRVDGAFGLDLNVIGQPRNLAIASPLNVHLLESIFPDARGGAYCGPGSERFEETIVVDLGIAGLNVGSQYSDSWRRAGVEFRDDMVVDHDRAVYHRLFSYRGGSMPAADYNAFRDFLLSRIDQQYVRFQK